MTIKKGIYVLVKNKTINESPYGYKDGVSLCTGTARLIPNGCLLVEALPFHSDLEAAWFRTSPVESIKETNNGYIVKTKNSVYHLNRKGGE